MARSEFVGDAAALARAAAFRADADRVDMLTRLETATLGQIDAFVDSQVTGAGQRRLFKMLFKAIALDQRS